MAPPGVSLPGPFGTTIAGSHWLHTLQSKFGQRFLYGNGPAQVGFGLLKEPHRLKKRTERNTPATHTVGKREAIGHPLPVVAIGLIPYIYRRASFSHRAAPKEIAPQGGAALSFFDSKTEVPTAQQSEAGNMLLG